MALSRQNRLPYNPTYLPNTPSTYLATGPSKPMPCSAVFMHPRLILIEGMPGSGKSTTVEGLRSSPLIHYTTRAEFYTEYDNPLNAFWNWGDGWGDPGAFEAPYDSRRFLAKLLSKTYGLVDRMLADQVTVVMEGYPTHLTVRNILKMGGTKDDCRKFFARFAEAVTDVNPMLIVLETQNWKERLALIESERGPRFSEIFWDSIPLTPYGRSKRVWDREGVLLFYEECRSLSTDLYKTWPHSICRFDPVSLGRKETVDRIVAEACHAEQGAAANP